MSDRIFLQRMAFSGRHGVTDEERSEEQQIDVDLEINLDLSAAGRSDDIADTVDYGALFELCREQVEEHSFHLLESIAEAIAAAVLERHPRVEAVSVAVTKPGVPIDGELDTAGVMIERSRRSAT